MSLSGVHYQQWLLLIMSSVLYMCLTLYFVMIPFGELGLSHIRDTFVNDTIKLMLTGILGTDGWRELNKQYTNIWRIE